MNDCPIAVTGMGIVAPGALDVATFWRNIVERRDLCRAVPPGRWILPPERARARTPGVAGPDEVISTRGFSVDPFRLALDGLDIDAKLLASLDPLFHFALHAGRDAFRAGRGESLDRGRIGVVLAAIALPTNGSSAFSRAIAGGAFERALLEQSGHVANSNSSINPLNAYPTALPAAIIAKALGLGGGSYTLDAACASSLYALKLACDELRAGRADAMLAGGVSRPDCLYTQMGFSQLKSLSPSGRCAPFDAGADGLVVGEGAGVVLLRRLDDAIAEGVPIHGVIRGIGLSNDIGGSLIAPDSEGQLRAMRQAYQSAGWRPEDVELIECHGTGTPLGDAVELTSLRTLWADAPVTARCAIGSVKSMVGHLLTGAGAVGLIKTLAAMDAGVLPPSLNFDHASPNSPLESGPIRVQTEPQAWSLRTGRPRRAAVSAFGFGGINAHVLVEQFLDGSGMAAAAGGHVSPRASVRALGQKHADARAVGMAPGANVPIAIVGMDARYGKLVGLRAFQEAIFAEHGDNGEGVQIDELAIAIGEFRVPPQEIPEILPQQLLMMQSVAAAMRDAGLADRERRPRMGAFIGIALDMQTNDFDLRWWLPTQARRWADALGIELDETELDLWVARLRDAIAPPLNATRTLGALGGTIASRIAREFGLGGPCFALSADAASGLRAVEAAVRALQLNELDAAIVGAVDLAAEPRAAAALAATVGHVENGDGAAGLVLKRQSDATAAGDRIYAVIRGIGAASGGGIDCPVSDTARDAARVRASADAGWNRSGWIAAGGTHADATAFGMAPGESIAQLVGHAGAATGIADLAKSAICLYQEMRPGGTPWLRNRVEGPRRAGVESTTFDGNSIHVLLEEAVNHSDSRIQNERRQPATARSPALFAIYGDNSAAMSAGLKLLDRLAAAGAGRSIEALAREWFRKQPVPRDARLAVAIVAVDSKDLLRRIGEAERLVAGQPVDSRNQNNVYFTANPLGGTGQIAFTYPGSGNHYAGMGRGIGTAFPELLRALDERTDRLADQFMPAADGSEHDDAATPDIRRLILAQVTHGILMTDLMRRLGLRPDAAIGYSLGESAALLSLDAWPERDELFRRLMQSSLFTTDLAGPCNAARRAWALGDSAIEWKAVVVPKPPDVVREALADRSRVRLLIVNTPGECVIGGERGAVDAFMADMRWRGVPIEGVPTVHCDAARVVEREYLALHDLPTTPPANIRFYSAAAGAEYNITRTAAAESITAQAIHGFDFPKLIRQAYADGVRVFIEAGPGGSCTRMIGRILTDSPHVAVTMNEAGVDEFESALRAAAMLIAHRVPMDLTFLYGMETRVVAHQEAPAVQSNRQIVVPTRRAMLRPPLPQRSSATPRPTPGKPGGSMENGDSTSKRGVPRRNCSAPDANWAAIAAQTATATASAHAAYLRFSQNAMSSMGELVAAQARLLTGGGFARSTPRATRVPSPSTRPIPMPVAFTREQCLEFAVGSVARVLGPMFAEVDSYPARVRLPGEPLMLVDRIVSVEGRLGGLVSGDEATALAGGRLITEHDVHDGAWYLDGGRAPVCITVEAGQADLFLSGYLGIDLAVKGLRTYRLLDATVTFQRGLPRPGETIRYDIRINKFVRRGETYLFFFEFDGTIDGKPMLTMRDGCAGFFTAEEVAAAGGVVMSAQDQAPQAGLGDASWQPFAPVARESYDDARLSALRLGDLAGCFGSAFENLPLVNPVRLPSGRMKLLDRVVDLDPVGGRFGLGIIRAELDILPDDWFLTCHFVDDMVMPGTLMYECCVHTLRVLLMRYGWVGEHDEIAHEPITGISSELKCRGPVTPRTKKVTYEVEIKEIGYRPEPFVIADALMYADGARVVRMTDMSLQLTGMTRERLEAIWHGRAEAVRQSSTLSPVQQGSSLLSRMGKPAIYDRERILAFAIGKPSEAFGEPYRIFDDKRKIARLPGPPFAFMDRAVEVEPPPWKLEAGGWIEAEYDVPPDAWYFAANRQPTMPFAVLLEAALQPCGWLAAYVGSALRSATDLKFRNLGGTATLHEEVLPTTGTLTTRVRMTRVSEAGGMIIQDFDMRMTCAGRPIYDGTTQFGFFTSEALAKQVGIRDAAARLYKPTASELENARRFEMPDIGSREPADWKLSARGGDDAHSHWLQAASGTHDVRQAASGTLALPGRAFRMIDRIDALRLDGGPHGLGFVQGSTTVDPSAWFFKAHFYQDPVWPGSLGLESFLQLMKIYALERWGPQIAETHRFEGIATGLPHTWAYRGQIIPTNRRVEVAATITRCDDSDSPLVMANGFLTVDGTTIYEMRDFGMRMVPKLPLP